MRETEILQAITVETLINSKNFFWTDEIRQTPSPFPSETVFHSCSFLNDINKAHSQTLSNVWIYILGTVFPWWLICYLVSCPIICKCQATDKAPSTRAKKSYHTKNTIYHDLLKRLNSKTLYVHFIIPHFLLVASIVYHSSYKFSLYILDVMFNKLR